MAFTAVKNGNWTDATVWGNAEGGDYPGKTGTTADQTVSCAGYDIVFDVETMAVRIGTVSASSGGSLTWDTTKSTHMLIRGSLEFNYGEGMYIGTEASPLSSSYTATIEYDLASNAQYGKISVNANGYVKLYGAEKTPAVELDSAVSASGTSLTLAETPTGWLDGDELCILSSSETGTARYTETEYITATTISGTSITLSTGVTYAHSAGTLILNMTRNIRFISTNSAYQGGDITGQSYDWIMQGVELKNCGGWKGFYTSGAHPQTMKSCTAHGSYTYGIANEYTGQGYFKDCIVANNASGGVRNNEDHRQQVYENCYFVDNTGQGMSAGNIKYDGDLLINCTFACNTDDGASYGRTTCKFMNCYLYGNYDYGLAIEQGQLVHLHNCYFGKRKDGTSQKNDDASLYMNVGTIYANDCVFNDTDLFDLSNQIGQRLYSSNHNQTAGDFRSWDSDTNQSTSTDTSVYKTSSPSIKLQTTQNGTSPYHIIPIKVSSGDTLSVEIYGKKESTSMFNNPIVYMSGCGIEDNDVFSTQDTNWNAVTLSGTATRSGVVQVMVVCPQPGGSTYDFWIDDITITVS